MDTLIIGCGDIGLRIARRLDAGSVCYGVIRSSARCDELENNGVIPWVVDLDVDSPEVFPQPLNPESTVVFYLAPPPASGSADLRLVRAIAAFRRPPRKWVYLSTSGVYGDHGGGWVTEASTVNPLTERATRRLSAEQQLRDWHSRQKAPVVILRVPGIYGPGRLPLARLSAGEPVIRPGEAPYTNLIHADDLATVCLAACRRGRNGEIYNVSGGAPCTVTEYYLKVAELARLPAPPSVSLAEARQRFGPVRWSFIAESRRLDVGKMLAELRPELRYRDLEEGIRASLVGEPDRRGE